MQDTRIAPYEQQKPRKIKPYEHKAHYYETDKMGIVHHSNHIRWMEEARMDLLEQLGYSFQRWNVSTPVWYISMIPWS